MELLVYALDKNNLDEALDRMSYKKGYPIVAMPDGHVWGKKETLPYFVIIKCPEISVDEIKSYLNEWRDNYIFNINSINKNDSKCNINITQKNCSKSGKNKISLIKIKKYLDLWNCTKIKESKDNIELTLDLLNSIKSDGFWEVQNITSFADISFSLYNSDTKTGVVTVNQKQEISTKLENVENKISKRRGNIISSNDKICMFNISMYDLLEDFSEDVKFEAEQIYSRRLYYFDSEFIESIKSIGGTITITKASLLSMIKNKLDD